jgi:ATP-binding cassette subfamily C protein CydD
MNTELFRQIKYLRRSLALSVILGVLGALAVIAQMRFLSEIVNAVFLLHRSLVQVEWLLVFLLAAILLRAMLVWGREVVNRRGAIRVKAEVRKRLFAHLLRLGPMFSRGERTGELVAVASEGIERLDAYVSRYLPQLFLSVLIPVLIIITIWPLDWLSAVLLLFTGPIIPLLMFLVGSYTEKRIEAQWTALSRMSAHFLDVVQGLTTLKIFGSSIVERERITRISNGFRDKTLQVLRYAFLSGAVLEFMTAMAIGVIATTLGVRLIDHGISFASAFFILLLTPEFYRPLQELGVQRHAGMEGGAAAKRMIEILSLPAPVDTHADITKSKRPLGINWGRAMASVAPTPLPQGTLTIDFAHITYTYPGKDTPALKDVSFSLLPSTCTAIVGRSGAGKSTIANLLLRFLEGESGCISVNDIPLTELPDDLWREYVALVPQRPYLFYGTVKENIRLARPSAGDDEITQAAEMAGALDFISQLPQGFDTLVGEQGQRLSAGQAQRLAIARAFLKDAPFLILDEPTSSLDPESESLIRDAIERLVQNRTVLVIAHRYNTIALAQQVIVLEHGCAVESGNPESLLKHDGAYFRLMGAASVSEVAR